MSRVQSRVSWTTLPGTGAECVYDNIVPFEDDSRQHVMGLMCMVWSINNSGCMLWVMSWGVGGAKFTSYSCCGGEISCGAAEDPGPSKAIVSASGKEV